MAVINTNRALRLGMLNLVDASVCGLTVTLPDPGYILSARSMPTKILKTDATVGVVSIQCNGTELWTLTNQAQYVEFAASGGVWYVSGAN